MKTEEEIKNEMKKIESLLSADEEGIYLTYSKRAELARKLEFLKWVLNLDYNFRIPKKDRTIRTSPASDELLLLIRKYPGISLKEICNKTGKERNTVYVCLKKMVNRGTLTISKGLLNGIEINKYHLIK